MNTDFEQDLRQLLGAAEPPPDAVPDHTHVLAQGNRALRRQTARRALAGAAAVAASAVVATSLWNAGRPSATELPGTSTPSASGSTPSASGSIHFESAYGDPEGTDHLAGDFDRVSRTLRLTVAKDDPQNVVETLAPIVVPQPVTAPIVKGKKGSRFAIVLAPPEVKDVAVSTSPWTTYFAGGDPDVDPVATGFQVYFVRLKSPAVSDNPITSVAWTTTSGERVSSLGDRSTPEVVPLSEGRTVRVSVLEHAGELAVDGPPDVGFTWMSLADADGALPGIHQGRQALGAAGPTDWFALYLLPEGSRGVTPTYAAGFAPRTAMIVRPMRDGRVLVVFDLGGSTEKTSPLVEFSWSDAAGDEHIESL
jgi:hypothetical protein